MKRILFFLVCSLAARAQTVQCVVVQTIAPNGLLSLGCLPIAKLPPGPTGAAGAAGKDGAAGRDGLPGIQGPPGLPGSSISKASDLIDCKVTTSGSTATVGVPCSVRMGTVLHTISQPAVATLSGQVGTGTLYFYWSYQGVLTASQLTTATLACAPSCSTAKDGIVPQFSVPIAGVDFKDNVFAASIDDMRSVYSTNVILCGFDISCTGLSTGAQQLDAGPNLITAAKLQAGQVTLCVDAGTVNAMACQPAIPYNGIPRGMVIQVVPANTNTGATTLAISGLSAKPVRKAGAAPDLLPGDLVAGRQITLTFDGDVYRLP